MTISIDDHGTIIRIFVRKLWSHLRCWQKYIEFDGRDVLVIFIVDYYKYHPFEKRGFRLPDSPMWYFTYTKPWASMV